jgi:hypothetical protein
MNFKEEYLTLIESLKKQQKEKGQILTNTAIATALGYNRSYFSQLIGEKGVVTEQHLTDLKLRYPEMLGNITPKPIGQDVFLELLLKAVNNTSVLVESNKQLVDTNARQTRMLETKTGVSQPSPGAEIENSRKLLELIAKAGTEGFADVKSFYQEANRVFYGDLEPVKEGGKSHVKGKRNN